MFKALSFFLFLFFLFPLPARGKGEEKNYLTIYNAASTTDLVDELITLYSRETGCIIHANPGGSGTLARQLQQGAGGDIFLSASRSWVEYLVEEDLVRESRILFWNSLVLIGPEDSDLQEREITPDLNLPGIFTGRLSLGDPDHVPAGVYGRQALEYFHWENLLARRLLPSANVRAALSLVEMGETELGIVYGTDALKSNKVKVIGVFPARSHSPIAYYSALLNSRSPEAVDFYNFMAGPEAEKLYRKYGFLLTEQGDGNE